MAKTTHIICILDRSGSMQSLETEVINSFNEFISDQKKVKGKAKVTLILFDDKYEVILDKVKLEDVKPLTSDVYFARGMTALNDAIGKTIMNMKNKKKAIVLIQTDGMENASNEYTHANIKELVKQKEKDGWEFVFLGANIDSQTEGACRGIANTVQFDPTSKGVKRAYSSMTDATISYRSA